MVTRGQALRQRDHVRLQIIGLAAKHITEATKATDDFIDQEQHVIALENRLDLIEIGGRRYDHATRSQHWLGDEGGNRIGTEPLELGLELGGKTRHEGCLRFALAFFAIGECRRHMAERG